MMLIWAHNGLGAFKTEACLSLLFSLPRIICGSQSGTRRSTPDSGMIQALGYFETNFNPIACLLTNIYLVYLLASACRRFLSS